MEVNIKDLHPTQLYLSEKKLHYIQMLYQSVEKQSINPISVLAFGDRLLITDGHHRAYQALLLGQDTISAEWDKDGGDELYHLYMQACEERKIYSILDLKNHILPEDEYEAKWYNWCDGFNQAAKQLLGAKKMPKIIQIDDSLRLVPYFLADHRDAALSWYQDVDLVELVDGIRIPYSLEKLNAMYSYLEEHGDLFWIEFREKGEWLPIGDVTLSLENIPIVIGNPTYQHQGLGCKVLKTLIDLARQRGWKELKVQEIYDFNYASRRCFESLGFVESGSTEKGKSLLLKLDSY